MARPIKQKHVGPSLDVPWGSAIQVQNSSGVAISANDIVYVSGRSGSHIQVSLADADIPLRAIGNLFVANHDIANGDYGFALPWKTVTGVNTSASSAAGAPVYLSGTAGGWSLTPGATKIRIGTVLEDHATTGAILLAPGLTDASSGGYGYVIADPGTGAAIPVTASGTMYFTTPGGGQTNSLAIPTFLGQRLILVHDVDGGGNRVITAASAINVGGNTVMTFADARDNIELIAIRVGGVLAWEVLRNTGVALS